jgi:hypothetical protein
MKWQNYWLRHRLVQVYHILCFLNVGFDVRSDVYFRKAVSFDALLNPYAIVVKAF